MCSASLRASAMALSARVSAGNDVSTRRQLKVWKKRLLMVPNRREFGAIVVSLGRSVILTPLREIDERSVIVARDFKRSTTSQIRKSSSLTSDQAGIFGGELTMNGPAVVLEP